MDSWWEVAVYHREPSLALYDDLERREGKGRETREGRDVCKIYPLKRVEIIKSKVIK